MVTTPERSVPPAPIGPDRPPRPATPDASLPLLRPRDQGKATRSAAATPAAAPILISRQPASWYQPADDGTERLLIIRAVRRARPPVTQQSRAILKNAAVTEVIVGMRSMHSGNLRAFSE